MMQPKKNKHEKGKKIKVKKTSVEREERKNDRGDYVMARDIVKKENPNNLNPSKAFVHHVLCPRTMKANKNLKASDYLAQIAELSLNNWRRGCSRGWRRRSFVMIGAFLFENARRIVRK